MEQKYFAMLPEPLQRVAAEIERLAGCTIEVKPAASGELVNHTVMTISGESVCSATIYCVDEPTQWALVHELLHIKRTWLEQTP